jgi:hypothetical protein
MTDPSTGAGDDANSLVAALDRALAAYDTLTELGEAVEDEWTYVGDLSGAWRDRLEQVAVERGHERLETHSGAAIDGAIDEIGRIDDPHKAIDWLSTFPQVVLLALAETT